MKLSKKKHQKKRSTGRQSSSFPQDVVACTVESILGVKERGLVRMPIAERLNQFLHRKRTAVESSASASNQQQQPNKEAFVHCKTGQHTSFGSFEVVKVSELERRVHAMRYKNTTSNRKAPSLKPICNLDISKHQGTLTKKDAAMVQVASNFNCLENGNENRGPDCGNLVDFSSKDSTQGPAAVFGTLSAYLWRAHFYNPPLADENAAKDTGTSRINCLQYVSEYFGKPKNGKLVLAGDEQAITEDSMDEVVGSVCIGLHKDCPIMFGRNNHGKVYSTKDGAGLPTAESGEYFQMVDHVLTASVNYNFYGKLSDDCLDSVYGSAKDKKAAYIDRMARTLLRASYEATYLSAILQGRKTLLLTFVGGGSFSNPVPIIVEEMKRAHAKWANHPASRLEKCQVCMWGSNPATVEMFN
ncbi:MAG: hypothetical protein SGILL_006943 [Bacillariaceae sp.]